jgi:PAS domain S-box-containing protein
MNRVAQRRGTASLDSESRFQALFNRANEAIVILDFDLTVLECNPAAARMVGLSGSEDLTGRSGYDFLEPLDVTYTQGQVTEALNNGHTGLYERLVRRVDGQCIATEVSLELIYDPHEQPVCIQATARDITHRKLRSADVVRSVFTSIGHDVRTPITVVKNNLYLLRRKLGTADALKSHVDVLEAQFDRIHTMMENAMEYTRLQSGQGAFAYASVQAASLVDAAIQRAIPQAEPRGQVIQSDHQPVPTFLADAHYLSMALDHLLLNAIRFSPAGGLIRAQTRHADGHLCLAVMDSGMGIPPEHQAHVFDPLYKVDAARQDTGNGLGLAIVRAIVEGHRGSVHVQSVPGEGTTVTLRIPVDLVG